MEKIKKLLRKSCNFLKVFTNFCPGLSRHKVLFELLKNGRSSTFFGTFKKHVMSCKARVSVPAKGLCRHNKRSYRRQRRPREEAVVATQLKVTFSLSCCERRSMTSSFAKHPVDRSRSATSAVRSCNALQPPLLLRLLAHAVCDVSLTVVIAFPRSSTGSRWVTPTYPAWQEMTHRKPPHWSTCWRQTTPNTNPTKSTYRVTAWWENFTNPLRQRGPTTGPRSTCGPRTEFFKARELSQY